MKISAMRSGELGSVYEPRYPEGYLDQVWNESLLDHLSPEDEVVWYPPGEKLENLDRDSEAILNLWIRDDDLREEMLDQFPKLKYVSTFSHGYGRFDREAVLRHGITVTNTIYGDVTIAQYAMALLLEICHNVSLHDEFYKHEVWKEENRGKRFTILTPQIELYGKTMGIIGLGNIGLWTAKMAAGFGMNVISYSRHQKIGSQY
ncbi:MAG: 2-hydroxyacid dehydrogenase, partial [Bulleidia sp.]